MSLELYSSLLTIGVLALTALTLGSLILFCVSDAFRRKVQAQSYTFYYALIALIGVIAVVGALIYQLYYLTPVCELCWWQRIFLFPIAIVALIAVWLKTKEAWVTIGVLACIGFLYACYHYYLHFVGLVLGNPLAVPCSTGGLLPSCGDSPMLSFGFATIPFMGVLVFLSILVIVFFAYKKSRLAD